VDQLVASAKSNFSAPLIAGSSFTLYDLALSKLLPANSNSVTRAVSAPFGPGSEIRYGWRKP
jgi:hypothetical protein